MRKATILIVDDKASIRRLLRPILKEEGYRVQEAALGEEALGRCARGGIDLVLLDIQLPDVDGLTVLERLADTQPGLPVVIMSDYGTIERAVRATRAGALDFLEKPLGAERVSLAVHNALEHGRLERVNRELRAQVDPQWELVGESRPMQELRAWIEKVAPTDGRVLILGETGTGKELVARAVHRLSPRAREPFVAVNCAAVPSEIFESELFGHEKGAFTGATAARTGRFEAAHRGTLLLDEIGDMPPAMQAKLLRVLEDGCIERVGGSQPVEVDVRVIAATNKDIEARVHDGGFRADLFHRLNVLPFRVAPLRERREDIPLLVRHFLARLGTRHGKPGLALGEESMALLVAHAWPGNVRELLNAVDRLVILADGDTILAPQVRTLFPHLGQAAAPGPGETLDHRQAVRAFERQHIVMVFERAGGSMAEAARLLGFERSHLYKKMSNLDIERSGG